MFFLCFFGVFVCFFGVFVYFFGVFVSFSLWGVVFWLIFPLHGVFAWLVLFEGFLIVLLSGCIGLFRVRWGLD